MMEPAFVANVLVLRECMHHLRFDAITIFDADRRSPAVRVAADEQKHGCTYTDSEVIMVEDALQSINPIDNAPPGGHYSHGTVANGFVFVSGQLPITPAGEKLTDASFSEQTRQALANVESVLKRCGSSIERLVQVRVYIDSVDNWPEFNAVYTPWAGKSRPSRAVVPTGPLHYGLKIEIEAVALAGA